MILSTLVVNYVKQFPFGKIMVMTLWIWSLLISGFVTNVNIFIILFGISWLSVGLRQHIVLSASQAIIPEHLLGRITSITSSIGVLGIPLGSLIGGVLLEIINPISLISLTGVCFITLGLIWLFNPSLFKLKAIDQLTLKDFKLDVDQ
jgi:MFS family permease